LAPLLQQASRRENPVQRDDGPEIG